MNCSMYFWNLRARVRAGVGESREGGVIWISVLSVLYLAIMRVDVNWIQKLYKWKEVSFGERRVSCGQLMPRICSL